MFNIIEQHLSALPYHLKQRKRFLEPDHFDLNRYYVLNLRLRDIDIKVHRQLQKQSFKNDSNYFDKQFACI